MKAFFEDPLNRAWVASAVALAAVLLLVPNEGVGTFVLIAVAFLQYVLDSRALSASGLFPSRLGRWNGIAYYVIAAIPIVRDALALGWPGQTLLSTLAYALIASTIASMLDRLRLLAARRAGA